MNNQNPINSFTKAAAGWLSQNAYIDEAGGDIKSNLKNALNCITSASNGPYDLLWGPSLGSDYLAYIAQSKQDGSLAVAFRGTSGIDNPWAFLSNWIADSNAYFLVPWQYPWGSSKDTQAKFSDGMYSAFLNVIAATDPDTSVTMLDFLRMQLQNSRASIMVTGHSLGGALANLAAVYLANQLPKTGQIVPGATQIVPFTFAAPTVTDSNFRKLYDSVCPKAYHAVNKTDIVPMAWGNATDILSSFPSPGQQLKNYLNWLEWWTAEAAIYSVPTSSYDVLQTGMDPFQGPIPANGTSFPTEAVNQHSMLNVYLPHVVPKLGKDGEWLDWLDRRLK